MRKALFVGIDTYRKLQPLRGCASEAAQMCHTLAHHADGTPNFHTCVLSTADGEADRALFEARAQELFSGEGDTALLYFAGHGVFGDAVGEGVLLAQDAAHIAEGTRVSEILAWAHQATGIRDKVLIFDCREAGLPGHPRPTARVPATGAGITLMIARQRLPASEGRDTQGGFTRLLVQGLVAGAGNLLGEVSPASLFAFVDNALGGWEQRPLFRADVSRFLSLRENHATVPRQTLRKLPQWFPEAHSHFALDPAFEDTHHPHDGAKVDTFKQLQRCNRHGLIEPVGAEHLYFAAMNSTACQLTALGAHYRELALKGRF